MGIYINGDHNSVNINGDYISENDFGKSYSGCYGQKPPIGFFGLLGIIMLLIWLLIKFWWIVLIVASLGALAFAAHLEREDRHRAQVEARNREELLAERAERQNAAYLRGEPLGTYGIYPPPPGVEREP